MKTREHVALWTLVLVIGILGWPSRLFVAPGPLSPKVFAKPELQVSTATVPLGNVMGRLPNSAAWASFVAQHPSGVAAHIDPRSGIPASIVMSVPLIPGSGKGNTVTLADLSVALARPVTEVSSEIVAERVRRWVLDNIGVLGIDAGQIGQSHAGQVTSSLWHISIPQVAGGVPVRDARLAGTLSHGNLVLLGAAMWGDVQIDTRPTIASDVAMGIGFKYAGGRLPEDTVWKEPSLELIPYAPAGREIAYEPGGIIGQGYGHRLIWSFGFVRPSEDGRWEVLVDAHAGEVIAFRDVIQYDLRRIKGGVYPATATEICPSPDYRCGVMQSGYPMPWTDTGLASPNNFTNGAGVFNWTSGTVTTTLHGKYFKVTIPGCGRCSTSPETMCTVDADCAETRGVCMMSLIESAGGELDLGGTNGQHRCETPVGGSAGNVPSARTAYYAMNKIAEMARGYLPNNPWLNTQFPFQAITPVVLRCSPEDPTDCFELGGCQAAYDCCSGPTPHIFFQPGRKDIKAQGQPWHCRPFGEILPIVDHEWGHALDDNDRPGTPGNGDPSKTGEAYGDIAAMYREQASCVGYGVWGTAGAANQGCDLTSDESGFNQKLNEKDGSPLHCFDDCNGLREADYQQHGNYPFQPDTPRNFVCPSCNEVPEAVGALCNRTVHCAAAPVDQAAWDFAKRDLQAPPFSYDSVTAFITANKLFYQGSGNIGSWFTCDCTTGAERSSGCAADGGYMNWVTADDDNGDIFDGTPHMTALYAAFHRHEIACSPNEICTADHQTEQGMVVPYTQCGDTHTSDNVREILEEGLVGGTSRLCHVWRFEGLGADTPRTLILEGYRLNNTEGDNFQFYWSNSNISCTSGTGWTAISGAEINLAWEGPPKLFPFGGGFSGTVYIKAEDTVATGGILDRVYVDLLAIGTNGPIPQTGSCEGGPTQAPTLTATPGTYQVSLTWSPVSGAVKHWVFRSEGQSGCDSGMALIANPTLTSYIDGEVQAGRQYCYAVMVAGGDGSEGSQCFGPSSACHCVTPNP